MIRWLRRRRTRKLAKGLHEVEAAGLRGAKSMDALLKAAQSSLAISIQQQDIFAKGSFAIGGIVSASGYIDRDPTRWDPASSTRRADPCPHSAPRTPILRTARILDLRWCDECQHYVRPSTISFKTWLGEYVVRTSWRVADTPLP
jgi:hypothetical protein